MGLVAVLVALDPPLSSLAEVEGCGFGDKNRACPQGAEFFTSWRIK
jgi:hypothetical protein